MRVTVKTKGANYVVDRDRNQWMRTSETRPRPNDGEWIDGGFTLGEVGESCFAHYASHPDGALGRRTSRVISIEEESK